MMLDAEGEEFQYQSQQLDRLIIFVCGFLVHCILEEWSCKEAES
jgi:hypothetical protein